MSKKNLEGNFINGRALAKDTKDSLIISEDKLVVSIGLENVVIVETRDAVLVSKKNCLDSLKEVVSSLNKKGFDEAQNHKKVYRPWGSFLSLEAGDSWRIKKIDVNGKKFDTNLHQAMAEIEDEKSEAGTVIQVIQPGYMLGERLLRPALVGVAKKKNPKNDEKNEKKEKK